MRQPLRATAALRAEQKIRKGTKNESGIILESDSCINTERFFHQQMKKSYQ